MSIVIDYQVLDHIFRIEAGTYKGPHAAALKRLRAAAEAKEIEVWISEIAYVEMIQGLELAKNETQQAKGRANDERKRAIADAMHVRRLGDPASKFGSVGEPPEHNYSRLDVSFRFADASSDTWEQANALEIALGTIEGVSRGDAPHLVSVAFPMDGDDPSRAAPSLAWFVSEDADLINAMRTAAPAKLAHIRFVNAQDLVNSHPVLRDKA